MTDHHAEPLHRALAAVFAVYGIPGTDRITEAHINPAFATVRVCNLDSRELDDLFTDYRLPTNATPGAAPWRRNVPQALIDITASSPNFHQPERRGIAKGES